MLIELAPMGTLPTPASLVITAIVLLLAAGLFALLRRERKPVQAVVLPATVLAAFFGVLQHELRGVYRLEHRGDELVAHTLLGPRATACENLEFLIRRTRSGCNLLVYRGEEEVWHSTGFSRQRCEGLDEELANIPCKPSDKQLK
nr:hypothetical protein [uncultured Aquabacterium sp.]